MHFKERYKANRLALIKSLGGRCRRCQESDPALLQFDHKDPEHRTWSVRKAHRATRLAAYRREAEDGKIQLLCWSCNSAKQARKPPRLGWAIRAMKGVSVQAEYVGRDGLEVRFLILANGLAVAAARKIQDSKYREHPWEMRMAGKEYRFWPEDGGKRRCLLVAGQNFLKGLGHGLRCGCNHVASGG